jgi:hypothetical protein
MNGKMYGDDHKLTNNWDADKDYGNEYAKVFFRVNVKGYGYPSFMFTDEDEKAFDGEIERIFTGLGWEIDRQGYNGACSEWKNGNSELYMHPQNLSGIVKKNDIKKVAQAIEDSNIELRWVDIYRTFYDVSVEEYEQMLAQYESKIIALVLQRSKTPRVNKAHPVCCVTSDVARQIECDRLGDGEQGKSDKVKYIEKVISSLVEKGYLVEYKQDGAWYIRTINKTEQKARHLIID